MRNKGNFSFLPYIRVYFYLVVTVRDALFCEDNAPYRTLEMTYALIYRVSPYKRYPSNKIYYITRDFWVDARAMGFSTGCR